MAEKIENSLINDLLIHSPFWSARLETLAHPVAIRMAEDLDSVGPLGIGDGNQPFWKGFKHHFGEKDSNIDFLLRIRAKHPHKVALVRIGEFYETWGIDSVFLVEHCGINRMGRKAPRAGLPIANIQSALNDLTEAGFSVVVCEQADDAHKNGRKIRFISEVITPSSPTYTYGLAMSHKANVCFPEAPPEFGIAVNSKGVKMVEINPDLRTSLILEGLTQEAAIIRLNKYNGRMNRVFLHEDIPTALLDAANLKFQNLVKISGYSSQDFPKRVEELIKIDLGLDADIAFFKTKPVRVKDLPHPLYQGTAEQIGILPRRGIPDLVQMMMPKGSPSTCKHIVRNLLLNPPPQHYATCLRQAIVALQMGDKQLPTLIVSNPVRYVKTLHKNEAHPEILKDLHALAEIFLTCQESLNKQFVTHILEVVSYISSIKAEQDVLNSTSEVIISALSPIIPKQEDVAHVPESELISSHLFERIEDAFRGRISRTSNRKIAGLYNKVEKAAKTYEKALNSHFLPIIALSKEQKVKRGKNPALSYDIHNHAIWMSGALTPEIVEENQLIRPCDRYGKQVKDRWTVQEVEFALQEYKEAAANTSAGIKEILKILSKELSPYCLPIIHLATFSNLVKTLYLHIKECGPRKWTANFVHQTSDANEMVLEDFFPYWMRSGQAVMNSLKVDGTSLLTGHNMSGKSTLIRSLATVTLLGSSGFMFPAKRFCVSQPIDGWFVRTGAGDDPEAGLSAFAVEMTDIKVALRDASDKSFLLIDELGKGTESQAGHAIAGSVLEHLIERKIRAIFATHWHELFDNCVVKLDEADLIKMNCDGNGPTYRVEKGVDLNSSAFYTALEIGVDRAIVDRAEQIAAGYENKQTMRLEDSTQPVPFEHFPTKKDLAMQAKAMFCEVTGEEESQIKYLEENQTPPLNTVGYSIVYIFKTDNNFFYVGETDNFLHRVKSHRSKAFVHQCAFFYMVIKKGKSHARKIEQELITKLKHNAFPMLSISDATNVNFGSL